MSSRREGLAAALEAMADPHRVDELVAERTLATAERHGAFVRELILVAALPRSFTVATLAALTGREVDDPALLEGVDLLLAYPFVHERANAGFAVHDSVRDPLLSWWRASDSAQPTYELGLDRLRHHYDASYLHAKRAADQLALVGPLIRSTNPHRFREVSEAIHDNLSRTAIDVLQLAVRRGGDEGVLSLSQLFVDMESSRRLQMCDLLVRAAAQEASRVPEDERLDYDGWVQYWKARAANGRTDPTVALELLDSIPEGVDLRLRTWVCAERTTSLLARTDFAAALRSNDEEIAIHEAGDVDAYNSSTPWSQKAAIHRQLWQADEEQEALDQALARANRVGNIVQATSHAAMLADTHRSMGDLPAAVDDVLRAFQLARPTAVQEGGARQRVCSRIAAGAAVELLGSQSARLLATFVEQHRQMLLPEGAEGRLDLLLGQARSLAYGGDRVRSLAVLEEAAELAADQLPERRWRVDSCFVELAEEVGQPGHGADLLPALLADPRVSDDRWELVCTRVNGAYCLLASGRLDEALEQTRLGRQAMQSMAHSRGVALTWAMEAEVHRRRGDLSAAREALASTSDEPARGFEGYREEIVARVALQAGEAELAAVSASAAMAQAVDGAWRSSAVHRGVLLVDCLKSAGRYADAARASAENNDQLTALHEFSEFEPTEQLALADQHAGRAVSIFVSGYGTMAARVRSADEHLDQAADLDPDNGWYQVEQAFLDMTVGRTKQASKHLDDAAERLPAGDLRATVQSMSAQVAGEFG